MAKDDSKDLIELMRKCKINDGIIMISLLGIGSHTAYYKVLYNRINNNLDKVNDEWIKKEVVDILKEIDRSEDE